MFKKTLSAAAVAGLLVLGGAAAAHAEPEGYPPVDPKLTAESPTITAGSSTAVNATGLGGLETAHFGLDSVGTGGSLSSIVFAAAGGGSVSKPVTDGAASATFSASKAGTWTVAVGDGENVLATTTITATAAAAGGGAGLPATGGDVPSAAIWIGAGAIALGGIAVAATAARRRAQRN